MDPREAGGAQAPLADRRRPRSLRAIAGNRGALDELRAWAKAWAEAERPPKQRAAVLEGPPGVGKTTAALAVAADEGWTVVELNASDARNESAIEQIAGRAALAHTLGTSGRYTSPKQGGRTLILLDEADCLSGRRTEESTGAKSAPVNLREFLRDRYGNVAALSKSWGLGGEGTPAAFEAWTDVPASPGRAAWTKLKAAQSDIGEWRGVGAPRDISDRGGLGAIAQLVRTTRQPLVLTVNDVQTLTRYSPVFRQGSVARIRFDRIAPTEVRAVLGTMVEKEGWSVPSEAIESIVRRADGDLRAALNDLEALHLLPPGSPALGPLTGRDRIEDIQNLVRETLTEGRYYRSIEIQERVDADPNDLFPWFEENLPNFARPDAALDAGFQHLALAELCLARARRFRVWRQWSYATEIMTGGVGIAIATHGGPTATRVQFPEFLRQMGWTRARRGLRDAVALTAGRFAHLSRRKARDEMLPFLERWLAPRGSTAGMEAAPARRQWLRRALDLGPAELSFLTGEAEAEMEEEPPVLAAEEPEVPAAPASPTPAAREAKPPRKTQRRLGDFGG